MALFRRGSKIVWLLIVLTAAFTGVVCAQDSKVEEAAAAAAAARKTREVQGEITWVKKDMIAVVFGKNSAGASEEEMLLPIAKDVKLQRIAAVTDLKAGDTVYLQFEVIMEEVDGIERPTKTVNKITLVRKGLKKPTLSEAAKAAEQAAEQGTEVFKSE